MSASTRRLQPACRLAAPDHGAGAPAAGRPSIALVGGTGLIGDPSGKSQERTLPDGGGGPQPRRHARNWSASSNFDAASNPARLINNADWLRSITLLEFLRDTGKHFTVNYMLAKESVKRRLGGEEGISFTEFSYLLLQAHDYLVLHERFGCTLQMGGSDQWGNITAGCDLIRKMAGGKAHGLVLPLVTTSAGTKFGKTEAGHCGVAGPARTSAFRFYQFWLNTDDRDVAKHQVLHLARRGLRSRSSSARSSRRRRRGRRSAAWPAKHPWCMAPRAAAGRTRIADPLRRVAQGREPVRSLDGVRGCALDDDDAIGAARIDGGRGGLFGGAGGVER